MFSKGVDLTANHKIRGLLGQIQSSKNSKTARISWRFYFLGLSFVRRSIRQPFSNDPLHGFFHTHLITDADSFAFIIAIIKFRKITL